MTRKIYTGIAVLLALFAFVQPSPASRLTAVISGKITDGQGFPLAGAYLYLASPAQLGIRNFITSETGQYGFPDVTPGVYKVTVELPGFKTVKIEGLVLSPGGTALINFKMERTDIEEEAIRSESGQGLDRTAGRLATVIDRDLLTHIPMPRDLSSLLGLVPGAAFDNNVPSVSVSFHGAPVTSNAFVEDGVNVTDLVSRTPMPRIDVDLIDQVVVETAGLPVDRGPQQGAFINIIRRSGANDFDGSLALYYTGGGLSKSLWSPQEIGSNNPAAPRVDRSNLDMAFTAGGPLAVDLGWFFSNVRFTDRSQGAPFVSWKDPTNILHSPYNWKDTDFAGMFKLSVKPMRKLLGRIEANLSNIHEPVYEPDVAWNRPLESTRDLAGQSFLLAKAGVQYTMDQGTSLDASVGYVHETQPLPLNSGGASNPSYFDSGTGRVWGSGPYNDRESRKGFQSNMTITHLQDKLFGVSHELVAGGDFETGKGISSVWKADDLVMNYFNGSPYTFGLAVSPHSENLVGLGKIGFSNIPGSSVVPMNTTREMRRFGAFVEDTLNFGSRATLSLGLRFDHTDTTILAV
ncbi:MAG: TonB-dependent receptor domain-containing protein, partial [Candidatus Aminicenantales bacterium]